MNVAIMQPYFLPYVGYFQLISAVDEFVVYDNIKYTKKGWINRNRYLLDGRAATFSVPIRNDSDYLDIGLRRLAGDFDRRKLLAQLREPYRKAPYFDSTYALLEEVVNVASTGLYDFLLEGLQLTCKHLGLPTRLRTASEIPADHSLRAQDRVIAIASRIGADRYINPIGGTDLYSRTCFAEAGIDLRFLQAGPIEYHQFGKPFVPWLSILDVLMFNGTERTRHLLSNYELH